MNAPDYIEIIFSNISIEQSALLTAVLSALNFEGFEEEPNTFKAYIQESNFDKDDFVEAIQSYQFTYHQKLIKSQNWNISWEQNFEPVRVDDFVYIRAYFHEPLQSKVQHELIITPKMSFGTGHHATTYMMIKQMQQLSFIDKCVLDFGTGTGILAILAEKLGATNITAIDIDEWSIANAKENIQQNSCNAINLQKSDSITSNEKFDIIVANINKNVILEHICRINDCLNKNGYLLVSGLLADDEADILANAIVTNLRYINTQYKEQWISMLFTR